MSARASIVHILAKTGMLLVALLVFTVLLAALPAHRAPMQQSRLQDSRIRAADADHSRILGTDVGDEHGTAPHGSARDDAGASGCARAHDDMGDARANCAGRTTR